MSTPRHPQANETLRAARRAHGWSRAEFARRINDALAADPDAERVTCSGDTVAWWEEGRTRSPRRPYPRALRAVLGCDVADLGFSVHTEQEDQMRRRAFLGLVAAAAVTPTVADPASLRPAALQLYGPRRRAGATEADGILRLAREWEQLDWGGGYDPRRVHDDAVQLVQALQGARTPAPVTAGKVFGAAAQALQVAGWIQVDAGRVADAHELLYHAVRLAVAAGDPQSRAVALSDLARQAAMRGHGDEALAYIALTDQHRAAYTPALRAMLEAVRGRAAAAARDWPQAHRSIGAAQDHYSNVNPADEPPYLGYYLDPAELRGVTGDAARVTALGTGVGTSRVAADLDTAAGMYDPTYGRSRALAHIGAAQLWHAAGEFEPAVAAGRHLAAVVKAAPEAARSQRVAAGLRLVAALTAGLRVPDAEQVRRDLTYLAAA